MEIQIKKKIKTSPEYSISTLIVLKIDRNSQEGDYFNYQIHKMKQHFVQKNQTKQIFLRWAPPLGVSNAAGILVLFFWGLAVYI